MSERVPVVVVGGGQAGLAVSWYLRLAGVEHVVLEAGRIGETWRTRRWDTFRLVSPNWLNRLPGRWYDGPDPHGFFDAAEMAAFLEHYAASFQAPVRTGVRVERVETRTGGGFRLRTSNGEIETGSLVLATGAFGPPRIPSLAAHLPARIHSLHSDAYRNPGALPPGGVLVVGTGQSGCQIADELHRSGRDVWLAVGRHTWVPRILYGRDQMWWRLEMGDFRQIVAKPGEQSAAYPPSALSRWGTTDFTVRTVHDSGVRLLGHVEAIDGERLRLATDLPETLIAGDEYARTFAGRVRDFARHHGEPVGEPDLSSAWPEGGLPVAPTELDLAEADIGTVLWTTGYRPGFDFLTVEGALAPDGAPYQERGMSPVPGLHYVGLHRMHEAVSGTVLGCGWVAEHVAERIAGELLSRPLDDRRRGRRPRA